MTNSNKENVYILEYTSGEFEPVSYAFCSALIGLRAVQGYILKPFERTLVSTNVSIALSSDPIKSANSSASLHSSMAGFAIPAFEMSKRGLSFVNSPGLIDTGYRGELKFVCINVDKAHNLNISKGQIVGNVLVVPTQKAALCAETSSSVIQTEATSTQVETSAHTSSKAQLERKDKDMNTCHATIEILDKEMLSPAYAHVTDNGLDLMSAEDVVLAPFERKEVRLGVSVHVDSGYIAQLQPRSGLAIKQGLSIVDSPSIITSDRMNKELTVLLINMDAKECISIKKGDRIAQLVVLKVPHIELQKVNALDGATDRGARGFGSSGKN